MVLRSACRQLGRRREAVLVVAARCVSVRSLVGRSFRELDRLTAIGPVVYWRMVKLSGEGTELGGLWGGGGTRTRAEIGEDACCAGAVEVWWCGEEGGSIISGGDRGWQVPVGVVNYEGGDVDTVSRT